MNGVSVVGELLNSYSPLTAVVPATRIKAGALPEGTALPAVAVTSISAGDLNMLSTGVKRRVNERVHVTVLAGSYRTRDDVLRLVRMACADKRGNFAGVTEVSVLTDGVGPDFQSDDSNIWMQTQTLSVSFNELTA